MVARRALLIPMLLLLPSLLGCQSAEPQAPSAPAPLSAAALGAVTDRPGVGRESLARAIEALFADEQAGETRALLVLHRGRIVAERYGDGFGKDSRLAGWSMTKSVTGVMIGMLVADGRLRLDETPPVPIWQRSGDPRGEITLRQLLQMRSGLRHAETAEPVEQAETVRMLFLDGRDDMAAYAETQPLAAVPGRVFAYSSGNSIALSDAAAHALTERRDPATRRKAVADYLRARLFEPIGMRSMVPEFDAAGTFIGSSMLSGTARDWAKFGEFLRHGGSVDGAQLVPRGWIDFMTSPSPRNRGYGAHLWLNREQADGERVLFPDIAPASLFACIGHMGQYVIVSPAQKLTVVRLGHTPEEQREALRERLGRIVSLFPAS